MTQSDNELWEAMNQEAPATKPSAAKPAITFEELLAMHSKPIETVEEPEELTFEMSPNLIKEPQTNSIVLDIADPLLTAEIITDSGEIVRTGSIELPILTNTGSIPVIKLPEDTAADDAVSKDFADNYVSSIAPVRGSSVMNSRARESVLPVKTRRGEGQTVLLAVTSILMVTVGALVIAAYMLGIFDRPLGNN